MARETNCNCWVEIWGCGKLFPVKILQRCECIFQNVSHFSSSDLLGNVIWLLVSLSSVHRTVAATNSVWETLPTVILEPATASFCLSNETMSIWLWWKWVVLAMAILHLHCLMTSGWFVNIIFHSDPVANLGNLHSLLEIRMNHKKPEYTWARELQLARSSLPWVSRAYIHFQLHDCLHQYWISTVWDVQSTFHW